MKPPPWHGLALCPPTPSPPGTAAGPASGQAGPTIRVWDAPPEPEAQGGVEGQEEHGAP